MAMNFGMVSFDGIASVCETMKFGELEVRVYTIINENSCEPRILNDKPNSCVVIDGHQLWNLSPLMYGKLLILVSPLNGIERTITIDEFMKRVTGIFYKDCCVLPLKKIFHPIDGWLDHSLW